MLLLLWSTTSVVSAATPPATPASARTAIPTATAAQSVPREIAPSNANRTGNATATAVGATKGTGTVVPIVPTASGAGRFITTTWGDPDLVSEKLSSWFPDIALDRAGTTHIIWDASDEAAPPVYTGIAAPTQAPSIRDYLMYQRFGTTPQPPATDIGLSRGGEAIRNAIVADRNGTLDVLYRSQGHIWFIKAPTDGAERANTWSTPRRLSGTGAAYYAAIAQDDAGALHVVFGESALVDTPPGDDAVRSQSLFYRHSTDGGATWSAAVRLSSPTSTHGNTRPQIRVQGTTIVVAWDEGYDNISGESDPSNGNIRRSLDGGNTWQPLQMVVDIAGPIEQLTFAFGVGGQALLVWRVTTANVIRYATSDTAGETWADASTVPGIAARPYPLKHQFDRYALIADGAGQFHLLAVGQIGSPEQLALMDMEFSDAVWTRPQIVYSGEGFPEYPGAVTDGGNRLVISFFVRDRQLDIGNYQVWRVEARTSAPVTRPHTVPTSKPANSSIRPTAAGTVFSTPVTRPGTILPEERPTIDHPIGVPPLGQSIFASFGVAIAVALVRLWWVKKP